MVTIVRSMPRPMTTTAMPTPRMPKVETLRTNVRRLPELRKPLSANEKMQNKAKAIKSTIFS
jgi:hypothetical protein